MHRASIEWDIMSKKDVEKDDDDDDDVKASCLNSNQISSVEIHTLYT